MKETLPVVVAAAILGDQWAGHDVCFHIDNTAAVAAVQSRSAREPRIAQLMSCLILCSNTVVCDIFTRFKI